MARTEAGRSLTERHYTTQRSLAWSLAYLLRAFWEGLTLGRVGQRPAAQAVTRFLDDALDAIAYYRQLSLAASHEYFVDYVSVEHPEMVLVPQVDPATGRPYRAGWGTAEVRIGEPLRGGVVDALLDGTIASIPGATESIVDEQVLLDVYDVADDDREDAEAPVATVDAPGEIVPTDGRDGGRGSRHHEVREPVVLVPDTPPHPNSVATRLQIKGPDGYTKQAEKIEQTTPQVEADPETGESDEMLEEAIDRARTGRLEEQSRKSFVRTVNAAATAANGAGSLVERAAEHHQMGYYRVLGPNPCSFCIALAAQAVIYHEDAYNEANARFGGVTGDRSAKVHDGCQCSLEPVPIYDGTKALPPGVEEAQALWKEVEPHMTGMNSQERMSFFRRVVKDGQVDERKLLEEPRPVIMDRMLEIELAIPTLMFTERFWEDLIDENPEVAQAAQISLDFTREQLDYRLALWEKHKFPDRDWDELTVQAVNRAAAIWSPDFLDDWRTHAEASPESLVLDDNQLNQMRIGYLRGLWLTERAPGAWENYDEHWSTFELDRWARQLDASIDPATVPSRFVGEYTEQP